MFKKLQQAIENTPEVTSSDTPGEGHNNFLTDPHEAKILVVSSNKVIRDRLSLTLADTYEVIIKENLTMIFQLFSDIKKCDIDAIIFYDSNPYKDLSIISMMKKYPRFSSIPIIVIAQEITEKRKIHYLENDIDDFIDIQNFSIIKQLINSKIKSQSKLKSIIGYSLNHNSGLDIISNAQLHIRTLEDVASCSHILRQFTNATITQERAFFELILNSLEHGQLAIDKEKRRKTKESGDYESYLDILCNRNKEPIVITYEKNEDDYLITIIDGGHGFNYCKYLKAKLSKSTSNDEKGISMANSTKDFNLRYNDAGNILQIKIPHQEKFKLWH